MVAETISSLKHREGLDVGGILGRVGPPRGEGHFDRVAALHSVPKQRRQRQWLTAALASLRRGRVLRAGGSTDLSGGGLNRSATAEHNEVGE